MNNCPYCDDWRHPGMSAPAIVVKRRASPFPPVTWDGHRLRQASFADAPDPIGLALGVHICEEHWLEPEVIALGPVTIERF